MCIKILFRLRKIKNKNFHMYEYSFHPTVYITFNLKTGFSIN